MKKSAVKPNIDTFPDAIDWDQEIPVFLAKKDDKIIIERYSVLLFSHQWLDTRLFILKEDAREDGRLDLWDPDLQQFALSNWKTAAIENFEIKLVPKGRRFKSVIASPQEELSLSEEKGPEETDVM